ncbi:MAG: hypothetical protein E7623_02770 [Ruminococcaceae bacterium]|nr:hypothetical protein [Oscillospiraceae bacterium]
MRGTERRDDKRNAYPNNAAPNYRNGYRAPRKMHSGRPEGVHNTNKSFDNRGTVSANRQDPTEKKSKISKYMTVFTTTPEDISNKPKEKIRFHTVRNKEKKPLPISFIAMALVFTAFFMVILIDFVKINEFTIEIAEMRAAVEDLEEEKKELSLAIESKNDLIAIERRAKELGMVKKDQVDKEYIEGENDDKIEMSIPSEENKVNSLFTLLNALGDNFRGIMEYIN